MEKHLAAMLNSFARPPFTTTKLLIILVLAVVGGLAVVVYEIETANFALEKYARAAAVLKDLDAVSSSTNEGVAAAADLVTDRVGELLAMARADPSLTENQHRLALALIASLPWLILSIIGVVEAVRREPDWQYGWFGCLALATLLGGVGYHIPTDVHWFYRYVFFPLATYSALIGLFFAVGDEDGEKQ